MWGWVRLSCSQGAFGSLRNPVPRHGCAEGYGEEYHNDGHTDPEMKMR